MPGAYHNPCPESGTFAGSLSRIADAVQECVGDLGVRKTAEQVGSSKTRVHEWGSDLHQWPAASLLMLASQDKDVADAVAAMMSGEEQPSAQPTDAIPEACEAVRLAGNLTIALVLAIQAGKFNRAQQRADELIIDALSTVLTRLKRNMRAAAR